MLSATVAGTIFISPSPEQVRAGIVSRVDVEKGVLIIAMNYADDLLSFDRAVEKARAANRRSDECYW